MRWLVFGAKGWIGKQVVAILKKREGDEIIETNVRADNAKEVDALLCESMPDRVMYLAGRTHGEGIDTIDYLELPGKLKENVRDNLFAPLALAILCSRRGTHLSYLGTGCIFDRSADSDRFTESSAPNFYGSSYSIVKGYTDLTMKLFDETVLNARIRMPITSAHHKRNFITKISTYEKVCSVENSMTFLDELLPLLVDMAEKRRAGTINLTNPGSISHDEILTLYKQIVDPSFEWKNFTIDEQNKILLSKRSNNTLDASLLKSLYPNVMSIRDAVILALERMAASDSNILSTKDNTE